MTQGVFVGADGWGMNLRSRLLLTAATAAALLACIAPSIAQAATIDSSELTEVRMINHFRAQHGLAPLRIDGTLTRTADWDALDMGTHHRFSHTDSRGRDPFLRLRAFGYPSSNTWRGENIAAGNFAPFGTYQQWLNSPPHKANWLNAHYHAIGISRAYVAGSPYQWYWVTEFGSRWTSHVA
jgi:uncharacterized protein YkwD